MQAIAAALGVQCNYCHVDGGARRPQRHGRRRQADQEGGARHDAARARHQREAAGGGRQRRRTATTRVGCATCHRGVPIPKQITDIVTEAAASRRRARPAWPSTSELREKFYGGQSYDFSENGLLADRAARQHRRASPTTRWPTCRRTSSTTRSRRAATWRCRRRTWRSRTRPAPSRTSRRHWISIRTMRRRKPSSRRSRSRE